MFVVLTPKDNVNIDAHEVGRSFSTLMSGKYLQKMCYSVESKGDLLNAVNDFLGETVVLPAANWADENLLNFHKIQEMEERRKRLKGKITEPYNHITQSQNCQHYNNECSDRVRTNLSYSSVIIFTTNKPILSCGSLVEKFTVGVFEFLEARDCMVV